MRHREMGPMVLLWAVLLLVCPGCFLFAPPPKSGADGNADKPVGEPNDTFAQAIPAEYDDDGVAHLQGSVETTEDVDVYDLGQMQPGDRITVEVSGQADGLDATVAVFDENGRLFVENDDRDLDAQLLDPLPGHHRQRLRSRDRALHHRRHGDARRAGAPTAGPGVFPRL